MTDEKEPWFLKYVPDAFEQNPFKAACMFFTFFVVAFLLAVGAVTLAAYIFGPEWVGAFIERVVFGVMPGT